MSEIKTYLVLTNGDEIHSEIVRGTILDVQKCFAEMCWHGSYEEALEAPEIGDLTREIADIENQWCGGEWFYRGEQWHARITEITNCEVISQLEKENAKLKARLAHVESEYVKDHQLIIDWMDFENRSIEKNGEYTEDEINNLIKRARKRIKEGKEFEQSTLPCPHCENGHDQCSC